MPLPLPPETAVELTERQLGVGDSTGPAVFSSAVEDKDPFPCSDSGAFASPRFVRLAGTNKPTRAMIAVRSRGMLRFMGAIFFLSPWPLREESPAVRALAKARLDPLQIARRGPHFLPCRTQQAGPLWARHYHDFCSGGNCQGVPQAAWVKTSRVGFSIPG